MSMGEVLNEIPDLVEPVIAFHKWRVNPDAVVDMPQYARTPRTVNLLCSVRGNHAWIPQVDEVAYCLTPVRNADGALYAPCSVSPSPPDLGKRHNGHGCGIYAYKTLETLCNDTFLFNELDFVNEQWVVGTVIMWGKCYEHETGWRSQFARINTLYALTELDYDRVQPYADVYGVPVEAFPVSSGKAISWMAPTMRLKMGLNRIVGYHIKQPEAIEPGGVELPKRKA